MANEPKAPKRLLPIGIQDFPDIRERGFVYVDKTARAYELITGSGKAFFLSRPRRFGKSLLCSTLGAIFDGRRELFGEIEGRCGVSPQGGGIKTGGIIARFYVAREGAALPLN